MKKQKKLKLAQLNVQSFTTASGQIKGGGLSINKISIPFEKCFGPTGPTCPECAYTTPLTDCDDPLPLLG